jgi:hypothetical protein
VQRRDNILAETRRSYYNSAPMKKALRKVLGVLLIIVGLVMLVTPATPGSWLALVGLEMLGIRLLVQRKVLSLLPPRLRAKVEAGLNRLMENRWFKKLRPRPDPDDKSNRESPPRDSSHT